MSLDHEGHQEIIIVRRGGGDGEEDHHGGVWKIAFADFMTALMCFFLVMWLINAANEQTRAAVASYFNPIKLVDRNTSRKGIDQSETSSQADENNSKGTKSSESQPKQKQHPQLTPSAPSTGKSGDRTFHQSKTQGSPTEQSLFKDPYSVLSQIAGDTETAQNSPKGAGGALSNGAATGASGGKAYRDPFTPDFWSEQPETPGKEATETARAGTPETHRIEAAAKTDEPAGAGGAQSRQETAAAETKDAAKAEAAASGTKSPTQPTPAVRQAAKEINAELAKAVDKGDKLYRGISVTPTDHGVMISLTDQLDFGMFRIGSAVPRRELVLEMAKISKILNGHPGSIRIDGYTDARKYKGGDYDNWQLSSARAQAAYYMLVRGGLDEKRVVEISGFADRRPKVKNDPLADANRRIEILLEPNT